MMENKGTNQADLPAMKEKGETIFTARAQMNN